MPVFRSRQMVGKYRIERKLGSGGFADVYAAHDTIEGIRVALKVPHQELDPRILATFRREIQLAARLEHPNILSLRFAGYMDDHFVIAFPLGEVTLHDRIQRRTSLATLLDFALQMIEATAYAHRERIIHCDIKPENFILFPGNRVRLTDFGIAKIAQRTVKGAGTGTLGYMAPEQAMGRPTFQSDVFSLGLILHRMIVGRWAEWPYDWPLPGHSRLQSRVHAEMIDVIQCALELDPRDRFEDADQMLGAYWSAMQRTLQLTETRRRLRRTDRAA